MYNGLSFLPLVLCYIPQQAKANSDCFVALFNDESNAFEAMPFDMDNDGDVDIVTTLTGSTTIGHPKYWYENDDKWPEHHISNTYLELFLAAGDLNNDGLVDVVSAYIGMSWHRRETDGTFTTFNIIPHYDSRLHKPLMADFDGDGYDDIVVQDETLRSLIWYRGSTNQPIFRGILPGSEGFTSITNVKNINVGDIDGDSHSDVISSSSNRLVWYRFNNASGTFEQPIHIGPANGTNVFIGKIDGDDFNDVLTIVDTDTDKISYFSNVNGDGSVWSEVIVNDVDRDLNLEYLTVANFDADDALELIAAPYYTDSRLHMFQIDGENEYFALEGSGSNDRLAGELFSADINNDGLMDVIFADHDTRIVVLQNVCPPAPSPTSAPTLLPTSIPTDVPTTPPTSPPTPLPSSTPTSAPTANPSSTPTSLPSPLPTSIPTATPTLSPTSRPTSPPTRRPTSAPTFLPTPLPTSSPSAAPTLCPTSGPTQAPSSSPTQMPTSPPVPAECGELLSDVQGDTWTNYTRSYLSLSLHECCFACAQDERCEWFSYFGQNLSETFCFMFDYAFGPNEGLFDEKGWITSTGPPDRGLSSDSASSEVSFSEQVLDNLPLLCAIAVAFFAVLGLWLQSRRQEAAKKVAIKRWLRRDEGGTTDASDELSQLDSHISPDETRESLILQLKRTGKHSKIGLIGLAFVDFVVDCIFVAELFRVKDEDGGRLESIALLSAVFLAAPMTANLIFTINLLLKEFRSQVMRDWFFKHTVLCSICVLLALANPEVLVIFMSGTFGSLAPGSLFQAPFSDKGRRNLHSAGLMGNFLEDIPQIVLQGLVVKSNGFTVITAMALATSALTVSFGLIRRILIRLLYHQQYIADRERDAAARAEIAVLQDLANSQAGGTTEMTRVAGANLPSQVGLETDADVVDGAHPDRKSASMFPRFPQAGAASSAPNLPSMRITATGVDALEHESKCASE